MDLAELTSRLDERLAVDDYADVDASPNGLQVGPDSGTVERVALAVDAAVETVERAVEADADLLLTHHGIVWGSIERVTGQEHDRIAPLLRADCGLYVAHLPLDGHQELGNAAGVADCLDLTDREPFGRMGEEHVGQRGRATDPYTADELRDRLAGSLDTGDGDVRAIPAGPDEITDVAVVTGAGSDWLDEAADAGADALVTGEGKGRDYHAAREAGVTLFLAGHYATETFGVQRVGELLADWGLETTFLDCPTGL